MGGWVVCESGNFCWVLSTSWILYILYFFESMLNERECEGNRPDIELDDSRDEVRVEVKLQIV